jgi:hypothetical protein
MALLVGLALLSGILVVLTPAVTRAPAAGAANADNSDPDYATVEFSDPWDFSNPADFPGWGAQGVSSYTVANGVLDANVNTGGGLIMAEGIAGTIPHDRTTQLHPIDATRLRKVAFRMWSQDAESGGLFWYTCDHIIPSCENGFPFTVHPGWNDYAFDVPAQATFRGSPSWSGVMKGLRLVPSGGSASHVMLDYLRVVPTAASSAPPAPPVPLPVVDAPSIAGGVDYATLARGNPWDMSQPSDIFSPANMSYGFNGTLLNGINAGDMRDAHFFLPLNGPIDGNRFHRLTFNVFYEGPFSLGFEPGGGMVARLIWETAGAPGVWQDSEDIVVYPGWNDVSIDLATNPSWAITDPDKTNRIGWAGQIITAVRFDPHEDIGARRFLVDNIKLAEDATGYGRTYDVKFHDNAWQAGTLADVYISNQRGVFGGTKIASNISVARGVNTFRWMPNPLPTGNVWVYVLFKRGAYQARTFATGPLRMTASPSPLYGVNPFGSLEGLSPGQSGVRARGWAIDPDNGGPVRVDFWADGRTPLGSLNASGEREDVAKAYPGFGAAHGFDSQINVPQGTHSVCAYGINVGAGANQVLGCRTVTVTNNPFGALDVVSAKVGAAAIKGWVIDPNTASPVDAHVYVDGRPFAVLHADNPRPDIGRAVPGYGPNHGYHADLALASGTHTVCAYGINTGPGANTTLGCKNVTLPSNPFGALDVVRTGSGGLRARGWALDPDNLGPISVHLYVQGGGAYPVLADSSRPDIGDAFPAYGKKHGFIGTLPGTTGTHTVCAYAINKGPGANILLGCKTG